MLSWSRHLRGSSNYQSTPKIAEAFHNVLQRAGWSFDHVAVDVGSLVTASSYMTRNFVGQERDRETVKIIHRQVSSILLRRITPAKSVAFFLDGSEPLWVLQQRRAHPGKRADEHFYRSAASPMVYALEERLLQLLSELRASTPTEFMVSGAGTPGPAAGKVSAWMLDLATRITHPPTQPPAAVSNKVSANDSFCLIGYPELVLVGLGATPFHRVTTVSLMQSELKSMSLHDVLEWLTLERLMITTASSSSTPGEKTAIASRSGEDAAHTASQRLLAAVRTDVVLLYVMCHGLKATDLSPISLTFGEVMGAYTAELEAHTNATACTVTLDGQSPLSGLLFDEHPVASDALTGGASLRLRPDALARVLTRAMGRPSTFPTRHCAQAATALEVALQTHAMLCAGGVPHLGWTPPEYSTGRIPEKPPKVPMEMYIGHLRHLAADAGTAEAGATSSPTRDVSSAPRLEPQRDRTQAVTGLETLVLATSNMDLLKQVVPLFTRGHQMPDGVATEVSETKNIHDALAKTRAVLAGVASRDGHPAARHTPSHYYVRTPGSRGPPAGWSYAPIHLGVRADVMSIRYTLNTSFRVASEGMDTTREAGLSQKDTLYTYDDVQHSWVLTPCAEPAAVSSPLADVSTLRTVTWNVQFDRHSGERTPLGRDGIDWCTTTRYVALAKVLAKTEADVIAMQEVEAPWCAYLMQQPWVRQHYRLSCLDIGHAISPWGVLMLVKKHLPLLSFSHANVAAFTGHTSAMPEVTVRLGADMPPLTIGSMHLLAPYSENNVRKRETQLANLVKRLQALAADTHAPSSIVMGDFNDTPKMFFRLPSALAYRDAWEELHPDAARLGAAPYASVTSAEERAARGYTIDGISNPYAGHIIEPEFYGRADRVLFAAKHVQPIHAELIGTESVRTVLQVPEGEAADESTTALAQRSPDYLHPSDHFGVLVEFQVL